MVMDTALVPLAVTGRGKRADPLVQRFGFGRIVLQLGQVQAIPALLRRQQQAPGQVFAAVDRCRFRIQGHLPERLQRIQLGIVQGLQEVGAGEMDGKGFATR
ncbi:hypothetical protein D3C73_1160360 [compost metagenome]